MRLSISPTPSNTPSNTPTFTPSPSSCPIICMEIGEGFNATTYDMAIDPSGRVIVVGTYTQYSGTSANRIIGLNSNGSIDNAFNAGLGITGSSVVRTIARQSDGKYVLGGTQTFNYDGNMTKGIFRINADGSFDNTFTPLDFGGTPVFNNIAIDSSGKIYAGGIFFTYDGNSQNGIIRFNSDGSKDTSFDIGSGFNTQIIQIIIPQSDGKVLVGGQFTSYSGVSANRIVRLNNDGSIDNTFNYGTGFNNNVLGGIQQSDGKYIIAGTFTEYSGITAQRIIRLNNDGSYDNTFNSTSGFSASPVVSIERQSDGKYLVGGSFTSYSGQSVNRICRLNSDGTLDTTFNTGGSGLNAAVETIKLLSNGDILAVGLFVTYNGIGPYPRYLRLNNDGSSDMCVTGSTPTPTPTFTTTPTASTATPTPTATPTSSNPPPTATPTITPTMTPTTTSCQCFYYDVVTYADDIARASGNTGPNEFRNGLVWVTYRNCDDSGFTNATFDNQDSPYQNAICVNGLAQYNPPSIFIWQDNVQKTDILSFVEQGGCCSDSTPTPTPTLTSTPTPTETNCECWRFQNELGTPQDITFTPCGGFEQTITMFSGQILYKCLEAGSSITSTSITYVPCTNPVGCDFDADCNSCSF